MKTAILFLVILILLPMVFADLQNFPNTIRVTISTNNTFNITTEQDTHTYDTNITSNLTFTFSFNLIRNITNCIDGSSFSNFSSSINNLYTQTFSNLSSNMNGLITSCDSITKQYGDVNTYFKLYASCNVDNELCKRDRDESTKKVSELSGYKTNFESCTSSVNLLQTQVNKVNSELIPMMQENITGCMNNLKTQSSQKFVYAIIGFVVSGAFFIWNDMQKNPSSKRSKMPGLGKRSL